MRTKYVALISLLLSNAAAQTAVTFIATLLLLPAIVLAGVNAWTSLGPDGGGALILVVDPQSPDTVYASTGTGLFKSTDGAGSWSGMSPLPAGTGTIVSLVVDPQNSGTLYAASVREDFGIDPSLSWVSWVSWVFKSTDGGATWRALQSGSVFSLSAPLAIDPRNSNVLYSGTYNSRLKSNAILKSDDGGATWKVSTAGLPTCCDPSPQEGPSMTSVVADPNNSGNVYAAFYTGLFKSTDGGVSWRAVYMYSGANKPQFRTVVLDAQNPGTLYAFDSLNGVFKSTDGGASWSTANTGLSGTRVISLAIDSQGSRTLYAGTLSGLYKSTDGGANWQAANSGLGTDPIVAVALDPWNSDTLYVSKRNLPQVGVFKTTDGGANWILRNSGLRGIAIDGLAIDPQDPATIYARKISIPIGGSGQCSACFGRLKSTDAGTSWEELPASGTGPLVIDPKNKNTLYAADGHTVLKSQDGGASWNSASAGLPQICASALSLSIDLQNTDRVYAAFNSYDNFCEGVNTGGSWATSDGGTSWAMLGQQPKGGGMHGIAIDPHDSTILYGWNGMGIFKSTDRGASWNTLNSGLPTRVNNPPQSRGVVYVVVIDPQSPGTLYAVLNGDGIFKSTDGGASWVTANSGLPARSINGLQNYLVTSLVIDPDHPGTLYASGDGVLRSTDGGATWSSAGAGLTTFFVNTLAIDPHDTRTVYAGTADGVFAITLTPDE